MTEENQHAIVFKEQKYRQRLKQMRITNTQTLIVDFDDLIKHGDPFIAELTTDPEEWLKQASAAALAQLQTEDPDYASKLSQVPVRVRGMSEITPLRKVGANQIEKFICVEGIVVRASQVKPQVVNAAFVCQKCGETNIVAQAGISMKQPYKCERCNQIGNILKFDASQSTFINSQVMTMQEKPEELPPGRMPQSLEVRMVGDEVVYSARPGDHVKITGILHVVQAAKVYGLPSLAFEIYLELNDVEVQSKELEMTKLDAETIKAIKELAKDPWIHKKIIASIAPSIYGYEHVKEAIMYLLFGGVAKQRPDVTIRGEINALLIGDPGIAKSLLLQSTTRIAPRGLYAAGRGASAAGLTAAVVRDKSGQFTLEAGALVLADRGVACLHPSSKILTERGVISFENLPVKEYTTVYSNGVPFDIAPIDLKVVSIDDFGRTSWQQATIIQRKKYKGELLIFSLASGFEVGLTKDHLLRDAVTFDWKPAASFNVGDYVIAPLRIPTPSAEMYVWDILPGECKVYLNAEERRSLSSLIREKFGTISKMARELDVRRYPFCQNKKGQMQPTLSELRTLCRALGVESSWRETAHNYYKTKLEPVLDERIGYILGFIFGDGYVAKTISVSQSIKHKLLVTRFFKYWNALFPTLTLFTRKAASEIRGKPVTSTYYVWHTKRKVLRLLLNYLGKDLSKLPITPLAFLKGFIAGVTGANGCSNVKVNNGLRQYKVWNITYTISNNRDANLNFVLALRRFGVNAHYKLGRGVGIITISNRKDCEILQQALAEFSVKFEKPVVLRETLIGGDSEKISPFLVQDTLEEVYETVGASNMLKLGLHSTMWGYLNNERLPSEAQISKILTFCEPLLNENQQQKLIQVVCNRDYLIERIEKIICIPYDGFLYDLRTPAKSNFAAEGLMCHNCIDELDKMRPEDRVAMHEALEQQTVTISKAGIMATLNARTAVLAAANPKLGRYDPNRNLVDNIDMPPTLLSRFDLIFALKDIPDKAVDERMSAFILKSHGKVKQDEPKIPYDLLRSYIVYAKKTCPLLNVAAQKKIQEYYLNLREGSVDQKTLAITPRQLEGLIRLTEAHARIALKNEADETDAEAAISLVKRSMEEVCLDVETGKQDIDLYFTGVPRTMWERMGVVLTIIRKLEDETGMADRIVVLKELENSNIKGDDAAQLIQRLLNQGKIYEPRPGFLKMV